MRFRSAKEDLQATTLAALRGPLAQLDYVASLRRGDGYEHWGLEKVYGKEAAQAALAEVHAELVATLLREPLARLFEQAPDAEMFERPASELLPPATGALRAQHFSLVWDALAAVARRRRSRRAA